MLREEMLGKIPLFESLAADDLSELSARLDERRVAAGEVIFREGEPGETLFVIEEGEVELSYGEGKGRLELTTLHTGQYFGELSLFDGHPRSASATATAPSRLLMLEREEFVDFIGKDPAAALLIMAEMGERLRQTNHLMSSLVSRNVNQEAEDRLTFGQRIADRVASFGGSWPFIGLFAGIMIVWMLVNIVRLFDFDPYPFILLNLCLSTLAAVQAPIIMMSQNRQSSKDKLLAENDYHVNLKSEMEISRVLKNQGELFSRLAALERSLSGETLKDEPPPKEVVNRLTLS